jgi:hypothetical protein
MVSHNSAFVSAISNILGQYVDARLNEVRTPLELQLSNHNLVRNTDVSHSTRSHSTSLTYYDSSAYTSVQPLPTTNGKSFSSASCRRALVLALTTTRPSL